VAGREAAYSTHFVPRLRINGAIPAYSHICLHYVHMDKALLFPSRQLEILKKNPLLKGAERPNAAEGNQTASAGSSLNTDHDDLKYGTPPFFVGCFVGRTSKSNSTWYTYSPKLLPTFYSSYILYKCGCGQH
jgi:hypothetical protein